MRLKKDLENEVRQLAKGRRQVDIIAATGIDKSYLSRFLSNHQGMSYDYLVKVKNYLDGLE